MTASALFAVVLMLAVVIGVASSDEPNRHVRTPSDRVTVPPAPSTTTTAPPTPSTVGILLPDGNSRLSAASRLGYAGLGPIQLGMTFSEVEQAGKVTIGHKDEVCPIYELRPGPGSALSPSTNGSFRISVNQQAHFASPASVDAVWLDAIDLITVGDPAIYTISGVHVGSTYDEVVRTYPNAVEAVDGSGGWRRLTITNPEGRTIIFHLSPADVVYSMELGLTPSTADDHRLC